MPITQHQKQQRKKAIGASDVPAILGLSPYRTAYDVWLDKTGQIPDQEETDAMRRGNYLERAILDYAEDQIGEQLIRNQRRVCTELNLAANCDALVKSSNVPVQAKSSRMFGLYGEGESDVPDAVTAQTHAEMLCTETEFAWVPVLAAALELRMYRVPLIPRFAVLLRRVLPAWWHECVELHQAPTSEFYQKLGIANVNPTAYAPSAAIARTIIREPGSIIHLPEFVEHDIAAYEQMSAEIKDLDDKQDALKNQWLAMMGAAEIGTVGGKAIRVYRNDGGKTITYVTKPSSSVRVVKNRFEE